MAVTIQTVSFDCARPWELAQFWSSLLDWPIDAENEADDEEVGISPRNGDATPLLFLKVPEAKGRKNRLHLDIKPDDQAAEVEHALSLGATRADIGQSNEETWVVLADPEGNEFCILRSR